MQDRTSYAFIVHDFVEANRIPSTCSVFTAELYAIYRAIKYISNSNWNNAVIFSDSLSALQAIQSFKLKSHNMMKLKILIANCDKKYSTRMGACTCWYSWKHTG